MPVIAFPPQTMSAEDVAAIAARVERGGHYRCMRATEEGERDVREGREVASGAKEAGVAADTSHGEAVFVVCFAVDKTAAESVVLLGGRNARTQ